MRNVPRAAQAPVETFPETFYEETILDDPELQAGQRLTLHAERPTIAKRDVRGRLARLTRRAVTVRKTIEVDVMHEELVIDYLPGDGTEMLELPAESIVVQLRAEEVEIVKHVRVVEEVYVSKRRVAERRRLDAVVRHEELEVTETGRGGARSDD